ncbi:MAG: L-serine ammonia-lyase [Microthrixaceae bacterium]
MGALSVFDMLKVGVGPSSSHTLGPWRAVQRWLGELPAALASRGGLEAVDRVQVHLYGSLALTGIGHATDQAICLALLGYDPQTIDVSRIPALVDRLRDERVVSLVPGRPIPFDPAVDILVHADQRLPGHANGMTCSASGGDGLSRDDTYYSVGGGFVLGDSDLSGEEGDGPSLPHPTHTPDSLLAQCRAKGCGIAELVRSNELAWRTPDEVDRGLDTIWDVMLQAAFRGCHTEGVLPGGLGVHRRAAPLARHLLGGEDADTPEAWLALIRNGDYGFGEVLRWISAFAVAVNEENANLGRVVTAPTNGAAGVVPAVLLYLVCLAEQPLTDAPRRPAVGVGDTRSAIHRFLLVAGEVGTLFKKGATISAAVGGCMAEVGVSSAMAAAALTEALGGSVGQALMAAEIAMEHHLGMTCDPVGGLVQVPCIERNTMGAVKAINAAELALASNPADARVSLDQVIETMRDTAESMSDRYKETSLGGLAVNVSVRIPEC